MDSAKSFDKSISLDDELTCSICLEIFNDPVSLPCLHSFCNDCIRSVPTQRHQMTNNVAVVCPQCRKPAILQDGTFDNLPKNFDLANIIAKFKQHQEQSQLKRIQHQSSLCTLHGKEFGLFCMTCHTALCTDCFSEHKSHEVENVAQGQEKCLADLNNMMLPQLTELCTALEDNCKKWKDANRDITNSVDSRCADVARKFATLQEQLVMKQTKIIADIQDKHRENITHHQMALITTKARLNKTKELLTEAKNLKVTDPLTTLKCYGDFAKRVQKDLNQDIQSALLVKPIAVKPYPDKLQNLIEKIQNELNSFSLESESSLVFDRSKTLSTQQETDAGKNSKPDGGKIETKSRLNKPEETVNMSEKDSKQGESQSTLDDLPKESEYHLEDAIEEEDDGLQYWCPPPPPHYHPPHHLPPPPPHHPPPPHYPHWLPPHHRPPHHGDHFPPPPPHHWGPRSPRHRGPCDRKWPRGGGGK